MSNKSNVLTLIEHLDHNPRTDMLAKELDICMLKFGSYISILKNKQLNQVAFAVEIIKDPIIQQEFCEYFSCENFSVALCLIFDYNPSLTKSKAVKDSIRYWKQNVHNKKTRIHI